MKVGKPRLLRHVSNMLAIVFRANHVALFDRLQAEAHSSSRSHRLDVVLVMPSARLPAHANFLHLVQYSTNVLRILSLGSFSL